MMDIAQAEHPLDAVRRLQHPVIGHAVDGADQHLDAVGRQRVEAFHRAVGAGEFEGEGVAPQPQRDLLELGELERGLEPVGGDAEQRQHGVIEHADTALVGGVAVNLHRQLGDRFGQDGDCALHGGQRQRRLRGNEGT